MDPKVENVENKDFQRRGFKSASEVGQETVASTAQSTEPAPTEDLSSALPEEISFTDPNQETETTTETTAQGDIQPQAETDVIRIGDKTFASEKEAWAYAAELDRKSLADDAFRQGLEAAALAANSNTNLRAKTEPEEYKIPDEYYTNPAKFFKERESQMASQVQQAIDQRIHQISTHEQTMSKFWSDYPDLAKSAATKDIAQRKINEGVIKYGQVETNKALKLIAEETRAYLKDLGVTTLPSKPLVSNTKPAASPGGGTTLSRPKTEDKPLNFVEQSRNIKRNRHKRS